MAGKHGGKRKGAGRKKGVSTLRAEEARRVLSERVSKDINALSDVLIKQAKDGDMRAMKELLDRAWGRPQQSVSVGMEDVVLRLDV